jgi:hypothetical protein
MAADPSKNVRRVVMSILPNLSARFQDYWAGAHHRPVSASPDIVESIEPGKLLNQEAPLKNTPELPHGPDFRDVLGLDRYIGIF